MKSDDNSFQSVKTSAIVEYMRFIFSKKYIAIISLVIAIVAFGVWYITTEEKSLYETIIVQKGHVVQEVSVVGKVEPKEYVNLSFEQGGKISAVYVRVGDSVYQGQELVRQDSSVEYAAYLEAQANLSSAQAKLEELKIGTRPEEIVIQETKVANAEKVLNDTKRDVINKTMDAYTKSDDAVRNKADQFFDNPQSSAPNFKYSHISSPLKSKLEWERFTAEEMLKNWGNFTAETNIVDDMESVIDKSQNNLSSIKMFFDDMALAINSLLPSASLTQTTIDGYKADIYAARTNINTAIANVSTAEEGFNGAVSSLEVEKQELSLMRSGPTPQEIAVHDAAVWSADAKLQSAIAALSKKTITSPLSGIVTAQEAKIGEIVSAHQAIVSIISPSRFEIRVQIPEVDIPKVKVGDNAVLTLDAYGPDSVFSAEVYTIDPAEVVIEGVPTYKVVLQLTDDTQRIRSGMTADINILTDKREEVFFVPARAIETRERQKFIKILHEGDVVEERAVSIGLHGSDGRVEIIEGLLEGEEVIVFTKR